MTLSRFQEPDKPQFGQGYCLFKYNSGRDYLWVAFVSHMESNVQQFKPASYTILSAMAGQKHDVTPETWDSMIPQILQNVSEAGRKTLHDATRATQPTNQFSSLGVDEMESWMLEFLSSLTNSPGWENTVSLVNEHHQTLAHLAVLSQYTTLLQKVAQWGIDVDVQDVNGFTALHCAYLRGDLDSVRVLKGYGADEDIEDTLGRRPLDMYTQRTNGLGKGSPLSGHISTLSQLSRAWEHYEKVSVTSSQLGSPGDNETTTGPLDGRHEPPHTCESSTSTRVMEASISVPLPVRDNSFATEEGGGIDPVSEIDLSIPVERSSPLVAIQSLPVTTPEYARSYEQEPEEPETFYESKRHRHQVIQSNSSQQTISKPPINSHHAGSDLGSPGEYGGLMQKPSIGPDSRITSSCSHPFPSSRLLVPMNTPKSIPLYFLKPL